MTDQSDAQFEKDEGFICGTCGKYHAGLPLDYCTDKPDPYFSIPEAERNSRCNFNSDLCVIDAKEFYMRGCLEIPIIDHPDTFVWGVWVSLSDKSFKRVYDLWDEDGLDNEPPFFGWLCTHLHLYPETTGLKTQVHLRSGNQRPYIELEPNDHPLAIEQRQGITLARIRKIAEAILHLESK